MSEEPKQYEAGKPPINGAVQPDNESWIRFDGPEKNSMIITIPLKNMAEAQTNNEIIRNQIYLFGGFKFAERQAEIQIEIKRLKLRQPATAGIIMPKVSMPTPLKVH